MTGQKMSMSISGRGSDIGWADDFVFAPQSPQLPQSRLGPSAVVSAGFRYRGEGFFRLLRLLRLLRTDSGLKSWARGEGGAGAKEQQIQYVLRRTLYSVFRVPYLLRAECQVPWYTPRHVKEHPVRCTPYYGVLL